MKATGHAATQGMRYRDLLQAVIGGHPRVRDAVSVWRHHPLADQATQSLVDATLAYQRRFDADWVKLTPAATWQSIDFGLVDAWRDDAIGRREVTGRVIRRPEDWATLKPLRQFTSCIIAAVEALHQRLPAAVPLLATVFSPTSQAVLLAGREQLLQHLQECPELVHQGLALLSQHTQRVIDELRSAGADGIHYAIQTASAELFPPSLFTDTLCAFDVQALATATGAEFNVVHLHGDALHPAWFDRFAECSLHFDAGAPGNPTLTGLPAPCVGLGAPIPVADFSRIHESALREAVIRLRNSMQGRRYMLAPGCSLPLGVDENVVDAFIAAARTPLIHEERR